MRLPARRAGHGRRGSVVTEEFLWIGGGAVLTLVLGVALLYWIDQEWSVIDGRARRQPVPSGLPGPQSPAGPADAGLPGPHPAGLVDEAGSVSPPEPGQPSQPGGATDAPEPGPPPPDRRG
jgi:hypothetical protein